MRAFVVCALGALAATAAAAPHMTSYNVSMLRSELPADSPLLARRPTPNLGYTPASAKLFVYFSAAAYCPQASIMAW